MADSPQNLQARDHRLDFWRGLCLVDMVIVHLIYEGIKAGGWLSAVLGEYTRFAAGGFIFLAGLGVSYIFLNKARNPEKRFATYGALWRRSLYLLFVHYAASLSFILIYPLRDFVGPYPHPLEFVKGVLLFREGCDLLIFYVAMVAISPAVLELIRRGYAWVALFIALALFELGQFYPNVLSLPIQQNFSLVLWQMIFVVGMLAGAVLPHYDRLQTRAKMIWAFIAGASLAIVLTGEYTGWAELHGIAFVKSPLTWAEAIRYLLMIVTIMLWTDLAWRWIEGGMVFRFLARLGRRSLAVYVAHVWVVALIVAASRRSNSLGNTQVLLIVAAIAMLWGWTCILDTLSEAPKRRGEEPAIGKAFWKLASASALGVMLLYSLYAAMPLLARRDPMARMLAKLNPTNLATVVADASDADAYDPSGGPLPELPYDDFTPDDVEA